MYGKEPVMKSPVLSFKKLLSSAVAFSLSHAALGLPLTHAQYVDHSEILMPYVVNFPEFVITADQRFVYAISFVDSIIAIFSRDPASGRLEFIGKVAEDTVQRTGVHNPTRILLSPDDKHIYVRSLEPGFGVKRPDGTTTTDNAMLVFERNPVTGALTQLDNNAADIDLGYEGRGLLDHPDGDFIASRDGNYLFYATANSHALTVFKRNANGILSEAQYIPGFITLNEYTSAIALTPDQTHLYLASSTQDSNGNLLHFSRNTTTGKLTYVESTDHLDAATTFARLNHMSVSPDGKFLYTITVGNKFQIFTISATGALTYAFTYEFSDPTGFPNKLYTANGFTFSNNGKLLYVIDGSADALLVFGRNLTTGALTYYGAERRGRDGVVGMDNPNDLKLSGDNFQAIVATDLGAVRNQYRICNAEPGNVHAGSR
jgi:6-phosphogluconolactonase (cycloisomerase 2 family)